MPSQQPLDDLKRSRKSKGTMTFEQLLEGIGELEFGRNKEQVEYFRENIKKQWGYRGIEVFRAAIMQNPDGSYYIPEQYDDFTIASLIAS